MTSIPKSNPQLANSMGLMAILLWSTSIGMIRSITEAFGPIAGAALIYTLSGILVLLFRGLPKINRFNPIYLFGCGFFFIIYEILLSQAIGLSENRYQSMEIGLINYLWPCLTVLFAVFLGLQKSSFLLWLGILISFTGIYRVLIGQDGWSFTHSIEYMQQNPIAYTFAFLAAITWALYCNLTRKFGQGQNAVSLFLIITGMILWLHYFLDGAPAIPLTIRAGFELIYISVATALAYSFWNYSIQQGNLVLLATASYFTPLLSMLFASIWLGTSLTQTFWQSVCLVTLGSFICWAGAYPINRALIKKWRASRF